MYPSSLVHLKKKERKKGKEKKVSVSVLHDTYAQSFLDFSDPFLSVAFSTSSSPLAFCNILHMFNSLPINNLEQLFLLPLASPSIFQFFSSLSLAKLLENLVYTSCLRISISQPLFKPLQLGFHHLFTQTLSTRSSVTSLLPDLRAPFNCLLNRPSFSSCDMLFSFLR